MFPFTALQVKEAVLVRCIEKFLTYNPTKTQLEAIAHAAKHKIPGSMVGSPNWFRDQLSDLLAMVNSHGMPSFFLTLTAGDKKTSKLGLQWKEVGARHITLY
jgi:hypothetical protein